MVFVNAVRLIGRKKFYPVVAVVLALLPGLARADYVLIKDGSILHGRILKIEGGTIELETTYAGILKVSQTSATAFATEAPINIALKNGTEVLGKVEQTDGRLFIGNGPGGAVQASLEDVTRSWRPGSADPTMPGPGLQILHGNWSYELAVDVTGKSGNTDAFGSTGGFVATRLTPDNTLKLYAAHAYSKQDGAIASNSTKAGADFSTNFTHALAWSWYVRDEIGRDEVKDLKFYDTAATGLGHDYIKNNRQTLTGRLGLAYRYELYTSPGAKNLSSPALDAALINSYAFKNVKMDNSISVVPSFEHPSNYRFIHDSSLEFPLSNANFWKLRVGLNNDYTSKPSDGKERLDTTYYTKLLFTWR